MLAGLHHRDVTGVPSRALTGSLEFRTLPLCALSYGDEKSNPWPVSSTGSHPALSESANDGKKGLGRSIYFAFRGSNGFAKPQLGRWRLAERAARSIGFTCKGSRWPAKP